MAQHKSAEKRARQTIKRTAVNKARKSRVRSAIRAVEDAVAKGDVKAAREALVQAQPEMDRAAAKGVFKKGTMSRKLSRLSQQVQKVGA